MDTTIRRAMTRRMMPAIASLVLAAMTAPAPAQLMYDFNDLGTLGRDSVATAIDANGLVVGWSEVAREGRVDRSQYDRHAFLWRSQMHDLGSLGGHWSEARDVNVRAEVVGAAELPDGRQHAFLYYGETMFDLNTLIGEPTMRFRPRLIEANSITDDSHIVACGYIGAGHDLHGFLLVPMEEGQIVAPRFEAINLGRLPDGDDCAAFGLNTVDEAVGRSGDQAFVWSGDEISALDPWFRRSEAHSINDWGMAVGRTGGERWSSTRGILWVHGFRIVLDTPEGWVSDAMDVSGDGRIVGWAAPASSGPYARDGEAMLWMNAACYNLNDITNMPPTFAPVITLERANGIDEEGRIVGCWRRPDGRRNAFLLTPTTPEPEN